MASFAELNDDNIVLRVIAIDDEHEENGEEWCHNLLGGRWKQTSYSGRIRGKYAGIGDTYDPDKDLFIGPEIPELTQEDILQNLQDNPGEPASEEILEIMRKMGMQI